MNINHLFKMQDELDARIEKDHPVVTDENRFDKKILALQVELGELANEWRGFKFWSKDQEPRIYVNTCDHCIKYGISSCCGCEGKLYKNRLLEEYVDCLHFILSIGLDLNYNLEELHIETNIKTHKYNDITIQFVWLGNTISNLFPYKDRDYDLLIYEFISLGEMLGFSWDQIEQAYYDKNEINHARQENGY